MISGRTIEPTDTCPHGKPMQDCTEAWCCNRLDDLLHGDYAAKALDEPETVVDARRTKSAAPFRGTATDLEGLSIGADPALDARAGAIVGTCNCGATWTGSRPAHCMACHVTFGSDTGFDTHRYGKFTPPGNRRCRDTEWMTSKGWRQDDAGIWRLPAPEGNPFTKDRR